jgi:hypothetical protein
MVVVLHQGWAFGALDRATTVQIESVDLSGRAISAV